MSTATSPLAPPAPAANPGTRAEQELLLRHLADDIRGRLAGDHPDRKVIRHRRPSQELQLGILPPLPQPDPDGHETPEQLARRINRPPSQIGVNFNLLPNGDEAAVDVAASFSFYVQRYPDLDEQRAQAGQQQSAADGAGNDGTGAVTDENAGTGSDANGPRQAADGDDGTAGRNGAAAASRTKKKADGSSDLAEIWERFDIVTDRLPVVLDLTQGSRGSVRIPLDTAVANALGEPLRDRKSAYPFRVSQQLPNSATQGTDADYWQAISEQEGDARTRPLEPPSVAIEVDWRRMPDGTLKVNATLMNLTLEPRRERRKAGEHGHRARELALFNSQLRTYERTGTFKATTFRQAPEDFRYADKRWVWASGQNCVARRLERAEDAAEPLSTETWPIYRQQRLVPNPDPDLQLSFKELAGDGFMNALRRVAGAMDDFEAAWRRELAAWPDPATKQSCQKALDEFHERDVLGFARGLRCLADDERLAAAFRAANETFRRAGAARSTPITTWRLFQVVYQVIHLASLRAREVDDPELVAELDRVDVLWFPTGGGKTEAYLGLIITLLFYDRLRAKDRGVSAILRFPLRMLSVQQLQRILDVLWFAERLRTELLAAGTTVAGGTYDGDEFLLGYWVGRGNSPNSLVNTKRRDEGDHISYWVNLIKNEPDAADEARIITRCPNPSCGGGEVKLEADEKQVRLRHRCHTCGEVLPVVISDDECYRYLPSVLVCTVDKMAHVARAQQFIGILAGPAYRCPEHGYFNYHEAYWKAGQKMPEHNDRCIAGELCRVDVGRYITMSPTHDPAPALQVQDELHLLEEELGTFNAHYETLLREMQSRFGTGKPTKLLAATATIEAYDEQVLQLYARTAMVFPSPGWKLEESFYVTTLPDAQRLYIGALPNRPDPREFGAAVQSLLHGEVIRMQSDPASALAALYARGLDPSRDAAWLTEQLENYELTLGYVNQKRDGDGIANRLARQPFGDPASPEMVDVQVLASEVATLAKIAEVLNRIGWQYPNEPDRTKRLRALVATSIVSHGVDIDALNLMVMNGMTPAVADYVQASSRAGRTHVGLVIVGYDNRRARDRSFYSYFLKYHEFLNRLISPVPVNRFAKFAAERTVPGVMSALLLQDYNRERLDRAGWDATEVRPSLAQGREFRRWWLGADPPADKKADFLSRVLCAVGVGNTVLAPDGSGGFARRPIFDPIMEASLQAEVEVVFDRQLDRLVDQTGDAQTSMRFRPNPLTSFRDVDEPTELGPLTPFAAVERALARN
jgi:Helicase conserved C-terminal domain